MVHTHRSLGHLIVALVVTLVVTLVVEVEASGNRGTGALTQLTRVFTRDRASECRFGRLTVVFWVVQLGTLQADIEFTLTMMEPDVTILEDVLTARTIAYHQGIARNVGPVAPFTIEPLVKVVWISWRRRLFVNFWNGT